MTETVVDLSSRIVVGQYVLTYKIDEKNYDIDFVIGNFGYMFVKFIIEIHLSSSVKIGDN